MPVKDNWDQMVSIPDEKVDTVVIAVSKALLAILELEKAEMVSNAPDIHEDGLWGLIFRSFRLKVNQPDDDEVIFAAECQDFVKAMEPSEKEGVIKLIRSYALPLINEKINKPL